MTDLSEGGTLMVSVANRETANRLVETAIAIADDRAMQILLLHVVEVPAQIPLSEGAVLLDEDDAEKRMLSEARSRCEQAGIEAQDHIRYARDVATGIVGAIPEHNVDALVMGWRGRPRRRDIILGSFIDRVLAEASCDVFVKRIRQPPDGIQSILVPVAGGPHCDLSIALARTLARQYEASVSLLHVRSEQSTEGSEGEGDAFLEQYTDILEQDSFDLDTEIVYHDHVAGAITDHAAGYDLTILGATREPFLSRKLIGSVAEGVARSTPSQVILTRRYGEE